MAMLSNEDKVLIRAVVREKGYGAKRLLKEFPNKGYHGLRSAPPANKRGLRPRLFFPSVCRSSVCNSLLCVMSYVPLLQMHKRIAAGADALSPFMSLFFTRNVVVELLLMHKRIAAGANTSSFLHSRTSTLKWFTVAQLFRGEQRSAVGF